jgi:predicted N-acetyltransferase YhbS
MRTLGLVDLCVAEGWQSGGVATTLLMEATDFGRACGAAAIILFADDDRLYARNGWVSVDAPCSWLKIHDHTTVGLAQSERTGALMVKMLGDDRWPGGTVDLLGHLF